MAREVEWTEAAVSDLEELVNYISRDSESYATAVVKSLVAASHSLGTLSDRGVSVPEFEDPSIRQLVIYSYRLVYQVGETVRVLRIIHGARERRGL